jgi:translocation and assembly module TamB
MSDEPEVTPSLPEESAVVQKPEERKRPSRLRRFFLRHLPLSLAALAVLLVTVLVSLYYFASSARFENFVRQQLVHTIETATGGRVEMASFHWKLLSLEADAGGLVIHGREAVGEAPYVRVENLRVRLSLLGFWSPRVLLRDLVVTRPQVHLIVYPDGTTNQPEPRKRRKPGKPVLDQFFALKASHIAVEQGVIDCENRAASFDFQDRFIPLDFTANDASVVLAYMPQAGGNPEFYHIEAGVRDLKLARGTAARALPPVTGYLQATVDLTRNSAILRSLRVTARGKGVAERSLEITGAVNDFARPRWQARAAGELDMRLLEAMTGYPFTPEGLARLELAGAGAAGSFRVDGSVHAEHASYIGTGVVAVGVELDARVHADPEQLLVTSIVARLRQGGEIDGDLSLAHWLPTLPGAASLRPTNATRDPRPQPPSADEITIPVDGKVRTQFKNVALDTVLELVSPPSFQRLGFDTRINGPANALWVKGDKNTLSVEALLRLTPPAQAAAGKAPAQGVVDATYTQRDGAVELRRLELELPASRVTASGHLGAYPLTSPSALAIELHTGNLGEFDTVLRDLGVSRGGKAGVMALPVSLAGQADFRGTWGGSLADPHLSGKAMAEQLTVEIPASSGQKTPVAPRFVHLDAVEGTGSYTATRIDLQDGLARKGKAEVTLSGSLTAAAGSAAYGPEHTPSFDGNSTLHLRLRSTQVNAGDLEPLINRKLPLTGVLNAQLQIDGALRALSGSGWIELDKGSVYGEPVSRARAQGSIVNQLVKLDSVMLSGEAGKISAGGSYDLGSHRFQLDARGAGLEIGHLDTLRRRGWPVAGKLGFIVTGTGTLDDPRLEGHATLASLTLGGESLGAVQVKVSTANRLATYDLSTRLEAAELTAHGQTALSGDHATQARLDFSRFNIGALLKLAHLPGVSGESSLAGTVTVEGPLAKPEQLRGEARLQELAVTLDGVHLHSQGGVHATLANTSIHLDPLHVTGEQTDLNVQGSLQLKDKRQVDVAASGAINLKIAETIDADLTASGNSTFQVEAHGPLANPGLRGSIEIQNASLSLGDMPNGLSQLHGRLEFNQNRLEVKSLTAMSGGGQLSLGGYLAYQHGLYADLTATGSGIRIRYPQGVSSQADAKLHLLGTQNSMLLSGDVLITRFMVSPEMDITALAAQSSSVQTIAPANAPSNHIRLDVHVASSPQLNFQNAYAKLAGNVDLRLRGTVASPSLLGRVSITEGEANLAGTRYELQRGEISFTNPVRIQPAIDINATARVEDYDITLGLHGTPEKMAVSYRSDPPLPEADVMALLALGRTDSQERLYTQQQQQAGPNSTDALLGGALNATVSSRVQRLFGAGSVKVDPNHLGALGNSTSRIIVEEQVGRRVTLTYATNVNTTGQQLLQAEVAINRHISLLMARDESGVFSMVLKATRRFR